MKKKRLLITAGPTIEPIDPIRYISNHSSGKMGYALARAAIRLGHSVVLISGPTRLKPPKACRFVKVTTAREMFAATLRHFNHSEYIFKVAAVADYRVKRTASKKIKKTHERLKLTLIKNPDILATLGKIKKPQQTLIGFAAETHRGLKLAQKKLKEKNLDWIVLNEINKGNVGFGSDFNETTLLSRNGKKIKIARQRKDAVARRILRAVMF